MVTSLSLTHQIAIIFDWLPYGSRRINDVSHCDTCNRHIQPNALCSSDSNGNVRHFETHTNAQATCHLATLSISHHQQRTRQCSGEKPHNRAEHEIISHRLLSSRAMVHAQHIKFNLFLLNCLRSILHWFGYTDPIRDNYSWMNLNCRPHLITQIRIECAQRLDNNKLAWKCTQRVSYERSCTYLRRMWNIQIYVFPFVVFDSA